MNSANINKMNSNLSPQISELKSRNTHTKTHSICQYLFFFFCPRKPCHPHHGNRTIIKEKCLILIIFIFFINFGTVKGLFPNFVKL